MALEGLPRSLRNLAPVGTVRSRIEHAHVGDGMLMVTRGEFGIGGGQVGDVGIDQMAKLVFGLNQS